jgi:hypothetical protein
VMAHAMRWRVMVWLLSLGLAGCSYELGSWRTSYSSVPTLEPSEGWSQTDDGTFTTSGMKLRVSATTDLKGRQWIAGVVFIVFPVPLVLPGDAPQKPQARPFLMGIMFEPSSEGFTFDPGRLELASKVIQPMPPS